MREVLTVSKLVSQIKFLLETNFQVVSVEGEVTNLTRSASGHWYFTLSDSESSLQAALFAADSFRNPWIKKAKNGDKLHCIGQVGVYPKRGTFQLIVKSLMVMGKGDLLAQFELLKKKLSLEGLFDLEVKKAIPAFPRKVGIITSEQGAALQDFINVFKRRSLWMDIVLIPALVQGEEAPKSLIRALKKAIQYGQFDVLVMARGGGSLEDLWAFNDENLARTIYECPIPIISAVGHEVDYTICDFVADFRAETPTAAAEILTGPQTNLLERLQRSKQSLNAQIENSFARLSLRLHKVSPQRVLEKIWERLNRYQKRMSHCQIQNRLYELTRVHEKNFLLDDLSQSLLFLMQTRLKDYQNRLERIQGVLSTLDPTNVLERGYCYLSDSKSHIVGQYKAFQTYSKNSDFSIHFHDGKGKVLKNE